MFRVELCPAAGVQEVRDVIWDTRLRGVKDQRPEETARIASHWIAGVVKKAWFRDRTHKINWSLTVR